MYRIFFLIVIVFCLLGCENKNTPLEKAMTDVETSWSAEKLKEFADKPDSVALNDEHFGRAMDFRNKNLRSPKDSTLLKYFHSLGIYHEDYMSSVVFASLHRKLNGKPTELEDQLKNIHSIMNEVEQRESKNTVRAKKYFGNYKVGDTILVRMPVDKGLAYRNSYPEDSGWIYNDSLDLLIKGTIKEKSETEDSSEILFKLKILSMNRDSVQVLMEYANVGDEIDVDLKHDIIEEVN